MCEALLGHHRLFSLPSSRLATWCSLYWLVKPPKLPGAPPAAEVGVHPVQAMEDEEDDEEEEEEKKPKVQPNVIRVPPPTYNSAGYPQHTAYQNPGYGHNAGYAQNPGFAQNPAYAQTLAFQQSMLNPQGFAAQRAGYGTLPQHIQVG